MPSTIVVNAVGFLKTNLSVDITENASGVELGHLACSVYMWTLQDLPAIIRQWWNDQDKQTAAIIEGSVLN